MQRRFASTPTASRCDDMLTENGGESDRGHCRRRPGLAYACEACIKPLFQSERYDVNQHSPCPYAA